MANKVILKDNDGTQLLPYVKTECVVDLGLASTIENGLMSKEDKSLIENWKAEFGKGIAEITYTKTGGDEEQVKITAYACVGFPNSEDYEPISSGEVILTSAGESGTVRLSVPKDAQYFIKTYTDNSSYSVSDKDTVYTSNGGVTEEISLDVVYNIFDVAMIELTNGKLVKPEDYVSDANSIYFNDRTTAVYIALNNTSSNASWGGSGTDIEGITNYTNMTSVFEDKDGKSNTNAILDTLKGTSSAALSTRNYVFPNGTVGYLPAAGEFKVVTNNLTQINAALTTAGGTTIATGTYYLTSSEYNSSNGIRCNGSGTASSVSKSTSTAIRPFKIATKEVSVIKNIKLDTGEVATGYTLKINGKDETNSTTVSLPIGKSIFEVSLPNYITVYGVLNVSANTESVTIEAVMVKEWQTVTFNISTNVSSPTISIRGPLPNGSNGTVSATVSGSSYTFSAKIGQNYTVTASKTDYEDNSTSVKIIQDTFIYTVSLSLEESCKTIEPYACWNDEYVDLGLPSGLLWSPKNVGAATYLDGGLYFQWADVNGYTKDEVGTSKIFDYNTTPYQTNASAGPYSSDTKFTKYLGSTSSSYKDSSATNENALKTVLDPEDDAAHVHMGGNWRMPTEAEISELIMYTSKSCVTVNGIYGTLFVSQKNANKSIFIPYVGRAYSSSVTISGSYAYVWSSSLNTSSPYFAYHLHAGSGTAYSDYNVRYYGFSVRGVLSI